MRRMQGPAKDLGGSAIRYSLPEFVGVFRRLGLEVPWRKLPNLQ